MVDILDEVACHVTTRARSIPLLLLGEGPLETVLKTGGNYRN